MQEVKLPTARIMIFGRAPVVGCVKTRLIPGLGKHIATRLHEHLVSHCLSVAVKADLCPVQLWCDSDPDHLFFKSLCRNQPVEIFTQSGNDLGERMIHAFNQSLQSSEICLIVGTDCPALTVDHYHQALSIMQDGKDAVIIPAEDGGYVLLGLRKPDQAIFEDINWGSGEVFRQTIQVFKKLKYDWEEMAPEWDVDRPDDVIRLFGQAENLQLNAAFRDYLEQESGMILTS